MDEEGQAPALTPHERRAAKVFDERHDAFARAVLRGEEANPDAAGAPSLRDPLAVFRVPALEGGTGRAAAQQRPQQGPTPAKACSACGMAVGGAGAGCDLCGSPLCRTCYLPRRGRACPRCSTTPDGGDPRSETQRRAGQVTRGSENPPKRRILHRGSTFAPDEEVTEDEAEGSQTTKRRLPEQESTAAAREDETKKRRQSHDEPSLLDFVQVRKIPSLPATHDGSAPTHSFLRPTPPSAAPAELLDMVEQPRREAPEDRWSEEDKEEIESLIRSRGPTRPRVVINQHQRDANGSRTQEEQQREILEELRERQKDLRTHPWVLAPWELPGRRGKVGMKNVRRQAMESLARTYSELPPETQPRSSGGATTTTERSPSTGLDDAEAENPDPDDEESHEEGRHGDDVEGQQPTAEPRHSWRTEATLPHEESAAEEASDPTNLDADRPPEQAQDPMEPARNEQNPERVPKSQEPQRREHGASVA